MKLLSAMQTNAAKPAAISVNNLLTRFAGHLKRSRIMQSFLCGMAVTLICVIPLFYNPYFYFQDDFQTSLLPVFLEIGSNIRHGEFHWLSAGTWFGGNFAGEYQYGLFNPVNLSLFALMNEFGDLRAAAAFYVLVHIVVLAAGIAFLARMLGSGLSASFLAALIGCTGSWLLYWGATTWIPAVSSMAWMSWAAVFLALTLRSYRWIPAAAVFCALTVLSGWVASDIALVVFTGISVAYGWRYGVPVRALWRVVFALAAGIALAAPALASTWGYIELATRTVAPLDSSWQVRPEHLLFWSIPTHFGLWNVNGQLHIPLTAPILYGSWVCLAAILWAVKKPVWRDRRVQLLVIVIFVAAAMSMMPSVWHVRWNFKFLAFFHVGLALLAAVLLPASSRGEHSVRADYRMLLLVLGVLYLLTLMMFPQYWFLHLVGALTVLLAIGCSYLVYRLRPARHVSGLAAGHLLVLVLFIWFSWPANWLTAWRPPENPHGDEYPVSRARDRVLSLYHFPYGRDGLFRSDDPGRSFWLELAPGNTGLVYRRAESINGYSPFKPNGLVSALCFEYMSGLCPSFDGSILFSKTIEGKTVADLLGVNLIYAQKGPIADGLLRQKPEDWEIAHQGKASITLRSGSRNSAPIVTEAPGGLRTEVLSRSPDSLKLGLSSVSGSAAGEMVIAVPWYPGWRATLDGERLSVRSVGNLVPAVTLPGDASGILEIEFVPQGLAAGLIIAAIGLLFLVTAIFRPRLAGLRKRDEKGD